MDSQPLCLERWMQCCTPALSMLEIAICDAESGRSTTTSNTLSPRSPELIIRMTTIRFNPLQIRGGLEFGVARYEWRVASESIHPTNTRPSWLQYSPPGRGQHATKCYVGRSGFAAG